MSFLATCLRQGQITARSRTANITLATRGGLAKWDDRYHSGKKTPTRKRNAKKRALQARQLEIERKEFYENNPGFRRFDKYKLNQRKEEQRLMTGFAPTFPDFTIIARGADIPIERQTDHPAFRLAGEEYSYMEEEGSMLELDGTEEEPATLLDAETLRSAEASQPTAQR